MSEKDQRWWWVDAERRLERLCLNGVEHFIAHDEMGKIISAYCVVRPQSVAPVAPVVPVVGRAALERAVKSVPTSLDQKWEDLHTFGRAYCDRVAREVFRAAGVTVDEAQP